MIVQRRYGTEFLALITDSPILNEKATDRVLGFVLTNEAKRAEEERSGYSKTTYARTSL